MTVLVGRPLADGGGLPAPIATGTSPTERDVPSLVSGTQLLGVQPGSGYVVAPLLVRRVDGQILQLTPLLYAVLAAVDGHRAVDQVAREASVDARRGLHPDDVQALIDDKLRPLGLVDRKSTRLNSS